MDRWFSAFAERPQSMQSYYDIVRLCWFTTGSADWSKSSLSMLNRSMNTMKEI